MCCIKIFTVHKEDILYEQVRLNMRILALFLKLYKRRSTLPKLKKIMPNENKNSFICS